MLGKTFGRMQVVELVRKPHRIELFWKCICTCGSGRTKVVRGSSLRDGTCRGCGCLNSIRLRPFESLYRKLLRDAATARSKPVPVALSYEDFLKFTKIKECHYCRAGIVWLPFQNNIHGYKLDRKNSSEGYSYGNCVVCCVRCNRGKTDLFTYDEWYAMTAIFRD